MASGRSMLGDTIRLGGPVVHVFDVDISPARLRETVAHPIA